MLTGCWQQHPIYYTYTISVVSVKASLVSFSHVAMLHNKEAWIAFKEEQN